MASEKVKEYKKQKRLYKFLSWFFCFGLAAIYIIIAFVRSENGQAASNDEEINNALKELKTLAIGAILIFIPMIVLSIIAKNTFKPTVWMVDIIMANILCGNVMMYITFAIWLIDTYFLTRKIKELETRIITRNEIEKG